MKERKTWCVEVRAIRGSEGSKREKAAVRRCQGKGLEDRFGAVRRDREERKWRRARKGAREEKRRRRRG